MGTEPDDRTLGSGDRSPPGEIALSHHTTGVALVTMRGEHDLSTRPELTRALERAAAHSNVVVDLSDCTFIDSSVVGAFIKTSKQVHAKGEQFVLVIPPQQTEVARGARLAGLDQIFTLHNSTDAAFANLEHAANGDEQPTT